MSQKCDPGDKRCDLTEESLQCDRWRKMLLPAAFRQPVTCLFPSLAVATLSLVSCHITAQLIKLLCLSSFRLRVCVRE